MEQSPAPTLSAHLLEESTNFLFYARRVRRSYTNLLAQETIDDFRRRLIDWRKTFAPTPLTPKIRELNESDLDVFYCRELLREVPGIVERTRDLAELTLVGISGESFVYLREAANCYIFGLAQAAVALARAAVEVPLRRAASKTFGKKVVNGLGLFDLLNDLAVRGSLLSREGIDRAHKIRLAADKVLHQEPTTSAEALEVVESACLVVIELSERPA
jgi:hypothetical protein